MATNGTTLTVLGCPFCGQAPSVIRHVRTSRDRNSCSIGCSNVNCKATIILRDVSFSQAVMSWNNRVSTATLAASGQRFRLTTPPMGTDAPSVATPEVV